MRLDYSIFMGVSERGGKNNSGDYEYLTDEDGNFVEFGPDHPQEGQLIIDEDLVNFKLTYEQIKHASTIPNEELRIAEAFIRFAQKHDFDFWRVE